MFCFHFSRARTDSSDFDNPRIFDTDGSFAGGDANIGEGAEVSDGNSSCFNISSSSLWLAER